ncbi:hypothetical protein TTHERM_00129800 (macronuclear) [Tetrahymena thermophila SB210]|uniref:Uncharacterized protein n=1 Tax=Tetrahymena thermophila (strain SB210) TaxID=312017 RepID=I7LUX0_TETTS|nr:hypothetical protein TTHERM_00129800 [Tetrahymena thermophila SB210]EAR96203.1 hypothetical protein TTHERM_00129800 [Tetrahymena thermophila SB210]|eukprot:XP_001016448.1 hypothetical protein TTHERM_00129800 [Tetrahymena thermophila SB210]
MGCTSAKQHKSTCELKGQIQNELLTKSKRINQIISTVQKLAIKIQNIYATVIIQNNQIPADYACLEPVLFLKAIKQNNLLSDDEIEQIVFKFRVIFQKMRILIDEISFILFYDNQNNIIPKQKKFILFEIIMLYDTTSVKFFEHYKATSIKL